MVRIRPSSTRRLLIGKAVEYWIIGFGLCRVRRIGFRNGDISSAQGELKFLLDHLKLVEVNQALEIR